MLIGHLLKWEDQPEGRSRSWLMTIRIQRRDTQELLEENPSLKPYLAEASQKIYESGRDFAVGETNLPLKTFPENCPYTLSHSLSVRSYSSNNRKATSSTSSAERYLPVCSLAWMNSSWVVVRVILIVVGKQVCSNSSNLTRQTP
jgi:hypothetical protein